MAEKTLQQVSALGENQLKTQGAWSLLASIPAWMTSSFKVTVPNPVQLYSTQPTVYFPAQGNQTY